MQQNGCPRHQLGVYVGMPGRDREAMNDQFARFFEAERSGVIRLAWLLTHDAAAAEDVAQDSFAAVFERFDGLDNPAAYLRRTVVNKVYERGRAHEREERRRRLLGAGSVVGVDGPTMDLADAVARLPWRQRAVVVLRYWADLNDREIGAILGLREGSVRSLLSRATAELRGVWNRADS